MSSVRPSFLLLFHQHHCCIILGGLYLSISSSCRLVDLLILLLFLFIRILHHLAVLHNLAYVQEREISFGQLQLQLRHGPVKSAYEEVSSTMLAGNSLVGQLILLLLQRRYLLGQLVKLGLESSSSAFRQFGFGSHLSQFQLKSFQVSVSLVTLFPGGLAASAYLSHQEASLKNSRDGLIT